MEKWLKARIENLIDNLIITVVLATIAAIGTVTKSLPIIVIISVSIGVFLLVLITLRLISRKIKKHILRIKGTYEDNARECGLIFSNNSSINLTNCQASLINLAFEIPHSRYSLEKYPKAENLDCTQNVAGFGDGKIPLFRWGFSGGSKDLEVVYKSSTQKIGYGILNVPILVLLNIWADDVQNTYAVCKLEDRLGWGYELSVLETGIPNREVKLATYQKSISDKEEYQSE